MRHKLSQPHLGSIVLVYNTMPKSVIKKEVPKFCLEPMPCEVFVMSSKYLLVILWVASTLAVKSPISQIGKLPTCAVGNSPHCRFASTDNNHLKASLHHIGIL